MLELKDKTRYPMRVKDSKGYLEFLRSLSRTALRRGDRAVLQNINKGDYND
jgi:hypothetical protein